MVKIKKLLIFIFMFLPVMVFAEENNIFLECSKNEAKIGETVECAVSVFSNVECTAVEFGLSADTGITFASQFNVPSQYYLQALETFTLPTNYIGLFRQGTVPAPTNSKFDIGRFTVKIADGATIGETYNISLTNGELQSDDPEPIKSNINVTAGIKVIESNDSQTTGSGLSDLVVTSGGNLVPAFDKNQTTFGVYLESATTTKFKLKATPENPNDTVSAKNTDTGADIDLNSDITFSPNDGGTMSITLSVGTGENAKGYTIIVQRDKPSGVGKATLSSLVIGGTRVNLKDGVGDYTVTLSAEDIKDYVIIAELTDPTNFKFANTDILSPHDLSGEQELEIRIVPKNSNSSYGSETYIITIKSSGTPSGDTEKPSGGGNSNTGNVNTNPSTGGSAIVMGILLVISFAASIYYYKRNMSQYD